MQGHVYHWKHGWIPLDHVAALSKAKGNHKRAAEMLSAGTSHDVGIKTRRDVAKAALTRPESVKTDEATSSAYMKRAQIAEAAARKHAAKGTELTRRGA